MSSPAKSARDQTLEFLRGSVEALAEEIVEIPEGWVVRTPSVPVVWSLNHVRIDQPIDFQDAVALAERYQSGSGFRQLFVDHEPSGEAIAGAFRAAGWEVDVEVRMELVREADRLVDTSSVIEPAEPEAETLMERWFAEDETLHLTREGMRQLLEYNTLTWRARNARRLGIRLDDGRLAAVTLVFSDGRVAQVEDVYAIPEARGRGFGRALVTRAVELAREGDHELVFIVADDNDWPKHLYAKLGFEPVGRTWLFHRDVVGERGVAVP